MIAAALNTMTSPWWNGPEIRCGKNCLPVRTATLWRGSVASTPEDLSRCCTGLYPRSAANTVLTGGRWLTWFATESGTPWACRPALSVRGSDAARPVIINEKKMPIDRDIPEFWNVDRMPDAEPRFVALLWRHASEHHRTTSAIPPC